MSKITNVKEYLAVAHLLPVVVQEDIHKRITDWLSSGGSYTDPYILQQFRYAEQVLGR